ncbi:hypothetical protein ACFWIJ_30030, partial [Streptomyces sp. NPDC127079]|uniref:hypothetical protein n=1 Tax=Streptomyces sp. NPDC127079 TaxID=3347132 RepID=UPI00366076DB
AVDLGQVGSDLAVREPLRGQRQDHLVDPSQPTSLGVTVWREADQVQFAQLRDGAEDNTARNTCGANPGAGGSFGLADWVSP